LKRVFRIKIKYLGRKSWFILARQSWNDSGHEVCDLKLFWNLIVGLWNFVVLSFALSYASPSVFAQSPAPTNLPPVQDPLMSLMISQPKVDINGPVNASAVFDPPAIQPGQETIYRVTFNALNESVQWPTQVVAPKELELRSGAQGEVLQMAGPVLVPLSSFNTRVRAPAAGEFTIPEFVVQVYGKPVTVPAARLEVSPSAPMRPASVLLMQITERNPYVGQPVSARVVFPASAAGAIQGLQQVHLDGKGFITDQAASRQQIGNVNISGTGTIAYTYETVITPIEVGSVPVAAHGFTSGMRFNGPIVISGAATIPGGTPQFTLIESDPVELKVRPLPREDELPGFTGAIGKLSVDSTALETNVLTVGEPVRLTAIVRGSANFVRLVAPPPPVVRDWQIFSSATNNSVMQPIAPQNQRVAMITYTLIPLTAKAQATPAIPFSCFDPDSGTYQDLTLRPLPVRINPSAGGAEAATLLQPSPTDEKAEKEPTLSRLAAAPGRSAGSLVPVQEHPLFPVVQLAPAAAFLGLWGWDRRRRYLEQHPEVVRRREARRLLVRERRSMRRAARAGDGKQFATAGVNALKAVCAPHFPAEPRAVVGRDVLQVVEQQKVNGHRELVAKFFSITDAANFATESADVNQLLGLKPGLESVLTELEQRL
jgi:hypothetical protein